MATHKDAVKSVVAPSPRTAGTVRPPAALGGLGRGFRALKIRNYRLFWFGQMLSLTGSWMQITAQAWLVLQLTSSPFAIGLVATLQFLPVTLLSLFGGVIADRLPKRNLLVITGIAGLIQAAIFGLLVATGMVQLWHVYVLATMLGIISAIENPVRQAFSVELVGREEVVNAVALNSMQFNSARVIGPAVAGLLIAWVGIAPALLLNAVSFVAVLIALRMLDASKLFQSAPAKRGPVGQNILEALSYSWRTPNVLAVLMIVGMIGTFGYNFSVVLPLLAGFVLNTGAAGFGGLSSFLGFGSLAGAVATAYMSTVTLRRLLISAGGFSVIFGALALSPIFALSAVLLVVLGFAGVIFGTTANSLIQMTVPDELRGRVMGLYILLFMGSTPIGAFFIGTVSSVVGVSETLLICAVLCGLGVAGALLYRARAHLEEA